MKLTINKYWTIPFVLSTIIFLCLYLSEQKKLIHYKVYDALMSRSQNPIFLTMPVVDDTIPPPIPPSNIFALLDQNPPLIPYNNTKEILVDIIEPNFLFQRGRFQIKVIFRSGNSNLQGDLYLLTKVSPEEQFYIMKVSPIQ